jgi:hypothetical protein
MKLLLAIIALAAFALTVPLIVCSRGSAELRAKNVALHEQIKRLRNELAQTERLSKIVASENSRALSEAELSELLRLRDEAAQLRRSVKEMDRLRRELDRITTAAEDLERKKQTNDYNPLLLLAEEMPLRHARIARLKAWLEDRPEELIPELHFLSERDWIDHATWEHVTDEEYSLYASVLRGTGENRFTRMAYKAVQKYGEANDGQFPTDLFQLQPYFESPIDDAILQRYVIVPASTLTFLSEGWTGGDWVITQRAPINPKWDSRVAIGLKSYTATVREARWAAR